jgi:phage terminase large subunit-like protein
MTDFKVRLHPGQAAIYNSEARFKVCAAGRRFGKSHYAAYELSINCLMDKNRYGYDLDQTHPVYYVAPTFDMAKRIMWPKLREILGMKAEGGLITRENGNEGWIELINKRRIYIKGADNPDSLRGIGPSYVVLDEYADMRPFVWEEILEPALMDVKGSALFIGTPKGKNHFYKLFMKAMGTPATQDVNGYDPALWEDWEAFHFKSLDNPFLDEKEVLRQMSNKSVDAVQQELEASFITGGSRMLPIEKFKIIDTLPGTMKEPTRDGSGNLVIQTGGIPEGNTYITVDLAGFQKTSKKTSRLDETVICTTFVNEDGWYVLEMNHGRWDIERCAMEIILACRRHPGARLGVEKGALMYAIGPYLETEMRRLNRYVTMEPLSHGNNKKADRILGAIQGRLNRGKMHLMAAPWNDWLFEQALDFPSPLTHDDGLDALAYTEQMASVSYFDASELPEWEPLDMDAGY